MKNENCRQPIQGEKETDVDRVLRGVRLVEVGGEVVDPAAEDLALHHELVHPLGVGVGGGGADQLPVLVPPLDLHPGQGGLQRAGVRLLRHVGLVVAEDRLQYKLVTRTQ